MVPAHDLFPALGRDQLLRRFGQREGIGSATVERWFQHVLGRLASERTSSLCPAVLGIDEHFFSRRHGYATTFCDLKNHWP